MKRTFISLLLVLLCATPQLGNAKNNRVEPQAEIKFDKLSYDFGQFSEDKAVVSCVFTFTNVGDAPLVISQCVASCGCTVPVYTEKPVEPGKTGQIKVTYNGRGRVTGPFKKIITVMSNAKSKMVRLSIQGEMVAAKQ
ncbi:MAG: DUF1573 domain-containing protein [Bacteroidaceae bacterium]|nr:DUF1573 domain-containing protein [Bacteroidaceae bacterium]MBR4782847.1 DUF1573 domain-containing protein [Bacteroidaceae bacterium]